LQNVELAIERVANRVLDGGHNISEDTIRRRYEASRRNFAELYKPLADSWEVYDNSHNEAICVARSINREVTIIDAAVWENLHGKND
jgi:predicted ABC-type ATPase